MASKMIVPKFLSEAEEAKWWFENSDKVSDAFEDARKDGNLGIGSVARIARNEAAALDAATTTAIFLDPDDLFRARALAAERGVQYQIYLKMLVHEALIAEEKKLGGEAYDPRQ